jgi:cytochrome c-type biogenesis protein
MDEVPWALAAAAGTLAALNPCGFALLPVYLTVVVIGDDQPGRATAVVRALAGTAAVVTGFAAVFGLFGLALAPVAGLIQARLPWFTVVLGLVLVGAGGWLIAGRQLPGVSRLGGQGRPVTRSAWSMAGFGAAYALASLGCTIGPFLAVVVSSFRSGSAAAGVGLFLAYAAGMGLVVGTAAVALALARTTVLGRARRLAPVLSRAGGVIVTLAGAYVAYYGWYELRILGGGDPIDPVIDTALGLQGWLSDGVGRLGTAALAAVFGAMLLIAALVVRRGRRADRRGPARAAPPHRTD